MKRILLPGLALLLFCTALVEVSAQSNDRLTVRLRNMADGSPVADATVRLLDDEGTFVEAQMSDAERGQVIFNFGETSVNDPRSATTVGEIRPNPAATHGSLPLSLDGSAEVRIALFDLLGRQQAAFGGYLAAGDHFVEIHGGGLQAGRYIVRVEAAGTLLASRDLTLLGGSSGKTEVLVAGGALRADKAGALPGTYTVEVSHPNYRPVERDVEVNGKTLVNIDMQRIEFIPEFGRSATMTVIGDGRQGLDVPRDLEFHPLRPYELWVVNRAFDGTVTYWWPGTDTMEHFRVRDANANHFMEEVSAIAFSEGEYFGTAQETINTYDGQGQGNNFMGPALWTADTSIYHKDDVDASWGGLGSHLDMLHESPNGMGMAHEVDNAYWYADGFYGNIVRYDFAEDHGPGWDDHSDGIVRRYIEARIQRWPGVPGHLELDKETGWLYIADPGNSRITRLDIATGNVIGSGNVDGSQLEQLQEYTLYANATVETFVQDGLDRPSGLVIHNGRLFVSDNGTGEIIAYSLETGAELNRMETNAGSIMGINMGPEGKIWFVDAQRNQVVRIDPDESDD